MTLKALKYEHTDDGFCRVYFSRISEKTGSKLWYCIQEEGRGQSQLYRATESWGEPEYALDPRQFSYPTWEGDTETDDAARAMIAALNQKEAAHG